MSRQQSRRNPAKPAKAAGQDLPAYKTAALAVVYRRLSDIKPAERNARTHSALQVAQITASIVEFGFTNPILIDESSEIIAGHARADAAKALGMATVPTIMLVGLTDLQKRAYAIADNRLPLSAGWSEELLRFELDALKAADFKLDLLGFTGDELAGVFGALPGGGRTDPDAVPALEPVEVSRRGDVWLLGAKVTCPHCKAVQDVKRRHA